MSVYLYRIIAPNNYLVKFLLNYSFFVIFYSSILFFTFFKNIINLTFLRYIWKLLSVGCAPLFARNFFWMWKALWAAVTEWGNKNHINGDVQNKRLSQSLYKPPNGCKINLHRLKVLLWQEEKKAHRKRPCWKRCGDIWKKTISASKITQISTPLCAAWCPFF